MLELTNRSAGRKVLRQSPRMGRQGIQPTHDHKETAFSPSILQRRERELALPVPTQRRSFRKHGDTSILRYHAAGCVQSSRTYARPEADAGPSCMPC
jgi:hypothetical protein